jgi:hypothetical protein
LEEKAPNGCTVKVTLQDTGNPFLTPIDDQMIQKAAEAYEQIYGKHPSFLSIKVPGTSFLVGAWHLFIIHFHKSFSLKRPNKSENNGGIICNTS